MRTTAQIGRATTRNPSSSTGGKPTPSAVPSMMTALSGAPACASDAAVPSWMGCTVTARPAVLTGCLAENLASRPVTRGGVDAGVRAVAYQPAVLLVRRDADQRDRFRVRLFGDSLRDHIGHEIQHAAAQRGVILAGRVDFRPFCQNRR